MNLIFSRRLVVVFVGKEKIKKEMLLLLEKRGVVTLDLVCSLI